jgi:renalase
MTHKARIAIVGAGMAGLAAGRELQRSGFDVVMFEKSRGLGGRVATRRVADYCFDHGAQILKTTDPRIEQLVMAIGNAVKVLEPIWTFDAAGRISEGDSRLNAEPKWNWPGGISTLAKYLGRDLHIHRSTLVHRLVYDPVAATPYTLLAENDAILGSADVVVLTPPAAQTAAILAASDLPEAMRLPRIAALEQAVYRRCLTFSCAFRVPIERPWYALVNTDRKHPIAWLAREHVKPERAPAGSSILVAQMADAWSTEHWNQTPRGLFDDFDMLLPASARVLLELLGELIGIRLPPPDWIDVQRWRHALPEVAAPIADLRHDDGLYVIGDSLFDKGRIHLAIVSGWQAAKRIAATFS